MVSMDSEGEHVIAMVSMDIARDSHGEYGQRRGVSKASIVPGKVKP